MLKIDLCLHLASGFASTPFALPLSLKAKLRIADFSNGAYKFLCEELYKDAAHSLVRT